MHKIAMSGKGGVGKTTLASLLAYLMAETGQTVYAIDADPNPTLAQALGFPPESVARLTPIIAMEDLLAERTGARPGEVAATLPSTRASTTSPRAFPSSTAAFTSCRWAPSGGRGWAVPAPRTPCCAP